MPDSSFYAGAKGFALDLTDMSKLYQDSARTTLVTATSDPIGSPTDLSGNGAHPVQSSPGKRPLFAAGATFDGTDDFWSVPAIDFTGTSKITIIACVRKLSDGNGAIVESDVNRTAARAFGVRGASAAYDIAATGAVGTGRQDSAASYAAPITNVITASFDISQLAYAGIGPLRINGAAVATTPSGAGVSSTGTFGNMPLYIGAISTEALPLNGIIYRLIVIGRELSSTEKERSEDWCGAGGGIFF